MFLQGKGITNTILSPKRVLYSTGSSLSGYYRHLPKPTHSLAATAAATAATAAASITTTSTAATTTAITTTTVATTVTTTVTTTVATTVSSSSKVTVVPTTRVTVAVAGAVAERLKCHICRSVAAGVGARARGAVASPGLLLAAGGPGALLFAGLVLGLSKGARAVSLVCLCVVLVMRW